MTLESPGGIPIMIASEDLLSESVLERLLVVAQKSFRILNRLRRGGSGYLKQNIRTWNQTLVKGIPLLLLTDLDTEDCAPKLRYDWLHGRTPHPNLIFRVAVREVEAWLMADRDRFADHLGVAASRIPSAPETEANPKQAVFNAAARSKRRGIREGIPPSGTRRVGP